MTMIKKTIEEIEKNRRIFMPDELKQYLIATYSDAPFPYEYSEQDLHCNIYKDICAYELGNLDCNTKSRAEHLQEEYENLKSLYAEKCLEVKGLELYVTELETLISESNIESNKMKNERIEIL